MDAHWVSGLFYFILFFPIMQTPREQKQNYEDTNAERTDTRQINIEDAIYTRKETPHALTKHINTHHK